MKKPCAVVWIFSVVAFATTSTAHDFASGKRMGFPPGQRGADERLLKLIPAGISESLETDLRGVIDRAKMWPQHETLIVCFLSGTRVARARVAAVAVEWSNYINLRLNFGDATNPRGCGGLGREHIQISFLRGEGHWSYVGMESWKLSPSMNLDGMGEDTLPTSVAEAEFRGIVLHEFGHALGFEHEHQSPAAKCDAEFDQQQLSILLKELGWSEADAETNLKRLQPRESLSFTRYDTKSVMHYSLPERIFPDGKRNKCWVPKNNELSEGDKKFAETSYPRQGGASTEGDRALGGNEDAERQMAEATYRASLELRFRETLIRGDLPGSLVDELTTTFRKEIDEMRSGNTATKR